MKKILITTFSLLVLTACVFFAACEKGPVTADENTVFITASDESFDFEGKTLVDYMNHLQDKDELTFEMSDGMIIMVNGKYNTTGSYWMLYTDDEENSNQAWGTFEHEGVTYGSAALGATELPVTENCVYIWAYQSFTF